MSNESMPNAEGSQSVNLSVEEFIAQRTAKYSQPEASAEPEQVEEAEEENEELATAGDELETEGTEAESEEEEVEESESEIDQLLNLSPEQIQLLAKQGKSRLLHRIGELTAKNKALEAQREQAQAEAKPLQRQIPAEENPFRALSTMEEVQARFADMEKVAEETDRILEDHEDYGADDIITYEGKEFTKKDIRIANRNARNAMAKYLPAQANQIQKIGQLHALTAQYETVALQEIPEIADAESPIAQQYQSLIADPLIAQVKDKVPELAPQLNYILAHALRSINSKAAPKTNITTAAAKTPMAKVPGTPFGAAGTRSTARPASKAAEQAQQQFEKSGRVEDLIAARAARLANR